MLPLRAKVTLAIVSALAQIFATIVALRNWYVDCIPQKLTYNQGLAIVFLPLLAGILVLLMVGMGVLEDYTDELYAFAGLVSTALLYVAVVQQVRGKCRA